MPPHENENQQLAYCPAHMEFITHMAEMRTSVKNIEQELADDVGFKRGIMIAVVGQFVVVLIQVALVGYMIGGMSNQISVNTKRLDRIESIVGK